MSYQGEQQTLKADYGRKARTMKKIILAVTLLTLAFSFSTAQKTAPIEKVQVTARTIARQPADQPYRIDLTRNGRIYVLAAGIDYSRVRIRTSKGEVAMSDMVKPLRRTGKLLVGTLSDMRVQMPALVGGTSRPPVGGTSQEPPRCKYYGTSRVCTCDGWFSCAEMANNYKRCTNWICHVDGLDLECSCSNDDAD
jgi:hypothetical protein